MQSVWNSYLEGLSPWVRQSLRAEGREASLEQYKSSKQKHVTVIEGFMSPVVHLSEFSTSEALGDGVSTRCL